MNRDPHNIRFEDAMDWVNGFPDTSERILRPSTVQHGREVAAKTTRASKSSCRKVSSATYHARSARSQTLCSESNGHKASLKRQRRTSEWDSDWQLIQPDELAHYRIETALCNTLAARPLDGHSYAEWLEDEPIHQRLLEIDNQQEEMEVRDALLHRLATALEKASGHNAVGRRCPSLSACT